MSRRALRLAEPNREPQGASGVPVTVAVAGRAAVDRLVRLAVDRRVVVLVPGARRIVGVDVLHAAARSPSRTRDRPSTAVGVGARYLEAVGGRAAAARWTPREICCLVSEVERRMTSWVCGPRLPFGSAASGAVRRSAAPCSAVRAGCRRGFRPALPAEEARRAAWLGRARAWRRSAAPGGWADERLDAWRRAGAVGGRLDGGLARELDMRWALELVVAPTPACAGLSTLREQVASAPRCGWCRLPVIGAACPRCALADVR